MSSNDEHEIIDVEAVEIVEGSNVPALVEQPTRTYRSEEPIRQQRDWPHGPSPDRRCVAHRKNGDRCKNAAIKGATVCRYHGGAARHVKQAARARLENAADLMAKELLGIALTAEGESVKLAAIRDALDRAGLKAPSEVVLSQGEPKAYETVFDSIGGDPEVAGFPSATMEDSSPAGLHASPAPAYADYGNGGKADAGADVAGYGDTGQHHAHRVADENAEPSSQCGPQQQGSPRQDDRDTQPQRPHGARSQRTDHDRQRSPAAAARELHITGMAAIRMANEANRESGVFEAQRAIESPHKRYPRP